MEGYMALKPFPFSIRYKVKMFDVSSNVSFKWMEFDKMYNLQNLTKILQNASKFLYN